MPVDKFVTRHEPFFILYEKISSYMHVSIFSAGGSLELIKDNLKELSKVSEEHLLLTVKIKGEIIFSLRSNFRDKLTGAFEELLVYMRNKHIYKYCILELSIDL